MTVTLKPEQEQIVSEAIRAGLIGAADDIVVAGIETVLGRLESSAVGESARQQPIDSAVGRLQKFGAKYRFSLGGLTIKELVNPEAARILAVIPPPENPAGRAKKAHHAGGGA